MSKSKMALLICGAGLLAVNSLAQADKTEPPAKDGRFYRLDFTVREVEDGKVVNGRSYSTMFSTARSAAAASIRTGNRLPIPTQGSGFQYMDVGVNIDVRAMPPLELEGQGLLPMQITADISSVAVAEGVATSPPPTLRTNKWSSSVIVPVRKPSIIFSSDDLTTKRKMQLEVTATPVQ